MFFLLSVLYCFLPETLSSSLSPFQPSKECELARQQIISNMMAIGVIDQNPRSKPMILVVTNKWGMVTATFDDDGMIHGQVVHQVWSQITRQTRELVRFQRFAVAGFFNQCNQTLEVTFKVRNQMLFYMYSFHFENSSLILTSTIPYESRVLRRKIATDCRNRTLIYDENGLSLVTEKNVRFRVCVRMSATGSSDGVEISTQNQTCDDSTESSIIFSSIRSGFILESRSLVFLFTTSYVFEFSLKVLTQHEKYFPLSTKSLELWIDCGDYRWAQSGLRDGDGFVSSMSMAMFVFFVFYGAITIYYMFAETSRSTARIRTRSSLYRQVR